MAGKLAFLAVASCFNPSMLAVVLYLASRKRPEAMLVGYLVATLTASTLLGVLVVEGIASSSKLSDFTIKISPGVDLGVGILLLVIGVVALATRWRPHRRREKPKREHHLKVGGLSGALLLGAAHALPCAYYLVALKDLAVEKPSLPVLIVVLLVYNAIMYWWTVAAVGTFLLRRAWAEQRIHAVQEWLRRHGRTVAGVVAVTAGGVLVVLGATGN